MHVIVKSKDIYPDQIARVAVGPCYHFWWCQKINYRRPSGRHEIWSQKHIIQYGRKIYNPAEQYEDNPYCKRVYEEEEQVDCSYLDILDLKARDYSSHLRLTKTLREIEEEEMKKGREKDDRIRDKDDKICEKKKEILKKQC